MPTLRRTAWCDQFLCVNNDGDFVSAEHSLQSRVDTCCPRVPCLSESGKLRGQRVPTLRESVFPSPKGSLKIYGGVLGTRNAGFVGWALAAHTFHVCPKSANCVGKGCPPYEERHGAYQFLCVNDEDFVCAERSSRSRVGTCCPRVPCLPESGKPRGQ